MSDSIQGYSHSSIWGLMQGSLGLYGVYSRVAKGNMGGLPKDLPMSYSIQGYSHSLLIWGLFQGSLGLYGIISG